MTLSSHRRIALVAVAVSLALLGVYLTGLPQRLTWANYGGDGGDLLAAILRGGVPHPSGYPTYVLLGRLFQELPWGSPYARGALLSALAAAVAGGLLCGWVATFSTQSGRLNWLAGLAAGLTWGLAPLAWSQAVITEVYGLHAFFCMVWLWWIALLAHGVRGPGMALLALGVGISLGNHLTVLLLVPPAAWALMRAVRAGHSRRFLAGQLACLAGGTLVYLYLPFSARHFPPVNWGNPQNLAGFWWLVSGEPYRGLLFHTPLPDLLGRVSAWARLWIEQFGVPGLLLSTLGVVLPGLRRGSQALLLWTFAGFSLFALGYDTADSTLYLLPACLAAAAWLGQGVALAWPWRWRGLPVGRLAVIGLALFLAVRLPGVARQVDARDGGAQTYAEAYLATAPQGAILLTQNDADTFPLWYAVYGLGLRPDVAIVVAPLARFDWYRETLRHIYPTLAFPEDAIVSGSDWSAALAALNPQRALCQSQASDAAMPQVSYACR